VDVGRVINETFGIYGSNLAGLLGSAAAIFIFVGIIQGLLYDAGGIGLPLLGAALGVAAQALYTGFVVKLVEDVRDGRRDYGAGELLSSASGSIVPLILNGLLRAIAVTIGFFLLIVPGLILLTIWAVTAPAIVVEREGVIGAFGRSWELVKGHAWAVFGVILIVFLITIGISLIAGVIGAAFGTGGRVLLGTIAVVVTAPIGALASAVMFFDLGGGSATAADSSAALDDPAPSSTPPPSA
jgi:hypothetical protein